MRSSSVPDPLFLNDAEIAKRVNMSPAGWNAVAVVLERSGMPRRDPLFGNQRCWPSVRDFLLRRSGSSTHHEAEQSAESLENLDALRSAGKRRARAG